jgi:hypothetical protein
MDYAMAKSTVVLPIGETVTMCMKCILLCPCWSVFDQTAVGLVEEGNYHWNITAHSVKKGTDNGHVISVQVKKLTVDACNPCNPTKIPIIGTVQPFIHDPSHLYTTSGLTNTCEGRYEVCLSMLNYASPSQSSSISVEVCLTIGKIVPMSIEECCC